jgi:hypothetical protein
MPGSVSDSSSFPFLSKSDIVPIDKHRLMPLLMQDLFELHKMSKPDDRLVHPFTFTHTNDKQAKLVPLRKPSSRTLFSRDTDWSTNHWNACRMPLHSGSWNIWLRDVRIKECKSKHTQIHSYCQPNGYRHVCCYACRSKVYVVWATQTDNRFSLEKNGVAFTAPIEHIRALG